ncbi:MAG: hypothetical protein HYY51_01365 [Candidatus Magasanikbacteria bacterium]|nr:hypothetical protein [Candidatus Magasanikbacteria bacterium]
MAVLVFVGLLLSGNAQAEDSVGGGSLVLVTTGGDASRTFQIIEVESPQNVPSRAGQYLGDVVKKANLFFTFNPVDKAQKALKYAQESMELASLMVRQNKDYEGAAKAMASANAFIRKVQSTSNRWTGAFQDETLFKRFLSDIDLHIQKRNEFLASALRMDAEKGAALQASANTANETLQSLGGMVSAGLLGGLVQIPPAELDISNDQDGDGLEDSEEPNYGTSIRSFDTDNDALSDSAEVEIWGTDPLNADTDGDGFRDGLEVIKGYNPKGAGLLQTGN